MEIKISSGRAFSFEADNPPVEGCTVSEMVYENEDRHITVFSLADGTSISAEYYPYPALYVMSAGEMDMYEGGLRDGAVWHMRPGDMLVTQPGVPVGVRNVKNAVYLETGLGKEAYKEKSVKGTGEEAAGKEGSCERGTGEEAAGKEAAGEEKNGKKETAEKAGRKPLLKEEAGKETDMNGVKSAEVFALKDLVPYQAGKIVNRDIVDNDHLKFVVMSFDGGTGLPEHAAPGEAVIFALEGKAVVGYEGKEYEISAGQNFKFDKGGAHYVKASEGQFKMALLLTRD